MDIDNLRNVPNFAHTIADRVWHEWWKNTDVTYLKFQSGIKPMTINIGIPMALVAHQDEQYVGSVLLIENDMDARPQYSPWIAALWVEPEFRRKGVADELIHAVRAEAEKLGFNKCYLCATDTNSPYYVDRGFYLVEPSVEGLNLFVV